MTLKPSVLYSLLILQLLQGLNCQSASTERVCEPGLQTGCSQNQTCTVNLEGKPFCIPLPINPLPLGALCQVSEDCPIGSGCLSFAGRFQCRAFCSVESRQVDGDLSCVDRLGIGSECSFALFEREEIGICTSPCRPDPPQGGFEVDAENDCLEEMSCTLPLGEIQARCMPPGERGEGEKCSLEESCEEGLSCVLQGDFTRCKKVYTGVQSCESRAVNRILRWTRDPITGSPYTACFSFLKLNAGPLNGLDYYLDLNSHLNEEMTDRCSLISGGEDRLTNQSLLAEDSQTRLDLVAELQGVFEEIDLNEPGVWIANETVDSASFEEGRSTSCQRLDLTSGRIEPTPCELSLPILCMLHPQPL